MTKAQEIAYLETVIRDFGSDSYFGPWLAEYQGQIVQDITSDLAPSPLMPRQARNVAAELVRDAKKEADAIIAKAATEAARIRTVAYTDAQATRDSLRQHLERVIKTLL